MALSLKDVPGDRTLDVMATCLEAITRISRDKRLMETIQGAQGGNSIEQMTVVLAVLKDHKEDVYSILAAIAGTTPEKYLASRNATEVIRDAYAVLTDEDALGFISAAPAATESHGARSESIEGQEA